MTSLAHLFGDLDPNLKKPSLIFSLAPSASRDKQLLNHCPRSLPKKYLDTFEMRGKKYWCINSLKLQARNLKVGFLLVSSKLVFEPSCKLILGGSNKNHANSFIRYMKPPLKQTPFSIRSLNSKCCFQLLPWINSFIGTTICGYFIKCDKVKLQCRWIRQQHRQQICVHASWET